MNNDEMMLADKPAGITSFGVVARVRRRLSELAGKRVKVGHTGTLDPFATGLMILLVGKGTKKAGEFSKLDKVYEATIRLGQVSSTGDPEGEISTMHSKVVVTRSDIEKILPEFVGKIEQTPPVFSAIKINGQRAYKLARKGVEVEMPKREVEIFELKLLDYRAPDLTIRAHVSSGTYIRTLAQDIGERLGCGAYTLSLRRTKVGEYSVQDAVKIEV